MQCLKCLVTKDASAFYVSNQTRCKSCVKANVLANRIANIERIRAYDRLRGSMPHRIAARAEYAKTPAFSTSHTAAIKRWIGRHPERRKANSAVGNAVRDGRLEKLPCQVCGFKAVAHHPDYSRPLDVVWLCQPHHKQAHALVNA